MNAGFAVRCACVSGLLWAGLVVAAQPKSAPPAKTQPGKAKLKSPGTKSVPSPKPEPKSAATDAKALQEWKDLDDRRMKLHGRLKDLGSEFSVSSRVRKLEIKKEFERLLGKWKTAIEPKMVQLSLAKIAADPDSELASRLAEKHPDQEQVVAVTERLIKAGKTSGPTLRLAGLASFNVNQFQRSVELLEQARDKNARLRDPNVIDVARDYAKHWDKEQTLRKAEAAAAASPEKRLPQVVLETSEGMIVVDLFENEAPNTVANFISLIEKKFFDGQHFYNSQPLRSVEAGDPKTKPNYNKNLSYGFGGPGYTIKSESTGENARMHFRGTVSMVNYGKDTEGSQFSLLRTPRPELNPGAGGLGGQTVFGRVTSGMNVVDKLENGDKIDKITVRHKRPHEYKPKTSLDKDDASKRPDSKAKEMPKTKAGTKSKVDPKAKAPAFPKTRPEPKPAKTKPAKTGKGNGKAKE